MLAIKAKEYGTEIEKVGRFFPSSKICSCCGQLKENLPLSERNYVCECGNNLDRDLNAARNILNHYSPEYDENRLGEKLRPIGYKPSGIFYEESKEIAS